MTIICRFVEDTENVKGILSLLDVDQYKVSKPGWFEVSEQDVGTGKLKDIKNLIDCYFDDKVVALWWG